MSMLLSKKFKETNLDKELPKFWALVKNILKISIPAGETIHSCI